MSEPIKVGDLVVVSSVCCEKNAKNGLGGIFTVEAIVNGDCHCWYCGHKYVGAFANSVDTFGAAFADRAPLPWVKRIPPLGELDDVKRDEEITA